MLLVVLFINYVCNIAVTTFSTSPKKEPGTAMEEGISVLARYKAYLILSISIICAPNDLSILHACYGYHRSLYLFQAQGPLE
jgi:hypothetical protein